MLLTTRLSNPELQREMYQQHLAFTQDLVAIAVEGLHLDVLEETIPNGPAGVGSTTVRQVLLQLERDDGNPIRAIEYTSKSRDEGRFLLVTDRDGAAHTERIVDNELKSGHCWQDESLCISLARQRKICRWD
jgi:replication-associated recombination protein RarA